MTNKRYFLLAGILVFISLAGVSCSIYSENYPIVTLTPAPVTQTPVATQPPTAIPTQTLLPTPLPNPTLIPYPTASMVKSNAVAFIAENALWVANVDGSGERKLTDIEENTESSSNTYFLRWSPDGRWISYISDNDLWIISPDGLAKKKIISIRDNKIKQILKYEWSPDGSKIAYAQLTNGNPTMVVELLDLVTGKISEISASSVPLTITLSWALDGKSLLLSKDTSFLLFDINTGKFVERKAKEESQEQNQCSAWWYDQLFWSPNGQQFALSWHGGGSYYSQYLCMRSLDGTADYGVNPDETHHSIYAIPPAWDKTGNYLYLVVRNFDDPLHADINPDLRLVRFNVKTRKVERLLSLTDDPLPYNLFWQVSISPDGNTLMLQSESSQAKLDLIFVDIQSLKTTKLSVDFGPVQVDDYPHIETYGWSPDGKNIIFFFTKLYYVNKWGLFDYGYFYALDIRTGKISIFSGIHRAENAQVSPIATRP